MMTSLQSLAASYLSLLLILTVIIREVQSIGCFVCTSINGSDNACEDPFSNSGEAGNFYQNNCKAGRKGRDGLFPATACVKMKAELDDYRVMVRQCVVDDGGINSETEIGRESHCWMVNMVNFDDKQMKGCSLACDTDGCNTGSDVMAESAVLIGSLCSAIFFVLLGTRFRDWCL